MTNCLYEYSVEEFPLKPDIEIIHESTIGFVDGTEISDVHAIVFATGFRTEYKMLDRDLLMNKDGSLSLYKLVFPYTLEKATLAIIGFVRPFGPVIAMTELQARWAANVLSVSLLLSPWA